MDQLLDLAATALFALVLFGMGRLTYWLWVDDDKKVIEHD